MSDEPTLETCPECNHPFIVHVAYGCHYGEDAELATLRAKAALFDALAAMRNIEVTQDKNTWAIWRELTLLGSGKTLADAVKAAMEAEGER